MLNMTVQYVLRQFSTNILVAEIYALIGILYGSICLGKIFENAETRDCPIGLQWNSDFIFLKTLEVIIMLKVDEKYWYL